MSLCVILGAGASKNFGMPLGDQLKEMISQSVGRFQRDENGIRQFRAGSPAFVEILRYRTSLGDDFRKNADRAARNLIVGLPLAESIDNYLKSHSENETIVTLGKLGIAHEIIKSENASKLWSKGSDSAEYALRKSWVSKLCQIVVQGCDLDGFRNRFEQITFINFNYDRCLEAALFTWVSTYFSITVQEASKVLEKVKIIRPYGSIGQFVPGENFRKKSNVDSSNVIKSAKTLVTFQEGLRNEGDRDSIHRALNNANLTIFLGFAFHNLNVQLLNPTNSEFGQPPCLRCIGTALGMSEENIVITESRLRSFSRQSNDLISLDRNANCHELLQKNAFKIEDLITRL